MGVGRQKAERFVTLDMARVPEKPVKPNRPVLDAIVCALGLSLGLAVAFGREYKNNVVLGEWELPRDTVVLGRVPPVQPRGGRTSVLRRRKRAPGTEPWLAAKVPAGELRKV